MNLESGYPSKGTNVLRSYSAKKPWLLASFCVFGMMALPLGANIGSSNNGHSVSLFVNSAAAAEIVYSVNGAAITSYDVSKRAAFLRIQGQKGGNAKATEQMIDQALKIQEGQRVGIRVAAGEVDDAFERFAKSNNMSTKQMSGVLNQAGVTATHFKEFIRAEMTWGQVLQVRDRRSGNGSMSTQDIVAKMLQDGGSKPTSTEYVLQQVIFVVPQNNRGAINARKREAEAMRQRFSSCDTTRQFAKGLIDVTVRDLGRMLEPELPGDWKALITKTTEGKTTSVRTTDRGVEFIGVCRAREVSDDKVAELKFRSEEIQSGGEEGASYLAEVRKNAQIIKR